MAARREAGVTQAQLAKTLSRPPSFVAKYELGDRRLDVVEFIEIAEALKADAFALFRQLQLEPSKPVNKKPSR